MLGKRKVGSLGFSVVQSMEVCGVTTPAEIFDLKIGLWLWLGAIA